MAIRIRPPRGIITTRNRRFEACGSTNGPVSRAQVPSSPPSPSQSTHLALFCCHIFHLCRAGNDVVKIDMTKPDFLAVYPETDSLSSPTSLWRIHVLNEIYKLGRRHFSILVTREVIGA